MEQETHATHHETSCSCCGCGLWLWRRGHQFWIDSPPLEIRSESHWMPPESGQVLPDWVLEAREAVAVPEDGQSEPAEEAANDWQNELIDKQEDELLVFCPRCYATFQKGMASGRALFNV